VFRVPRTRARTTLPKLPSPTSLMTSNLRSRGCATPSWKPSDGTIGVIPYDDDDSGGGSRRSGMKFQGTRMSQLDV
jgi:hypothetical protein